MDISTAPRRPRTRVVLSALVCGGLTAATAAVVLASTATPVKAADCGPGGTVLDLPGLPPACAHADQPPPGVDVTEPVSTSELQARPGAGEKAHEVAQDAGVPTTPAAAAATPAVTCEGDGTSGYRVQAMYVVEDGKSNRFASLESSFKLWAAGVDDVINRSAALTGGVRRVRYVTEAGANGTCEAKVLNVTVPAGATASFGATINAVRALGYESPARKYLMWVDANVLCGVGTMYTSDSEAQSNPNNGSYAQFARVDSGCWGFGDGARSISVEAHELVHNLGGVQNTAPHTTNAGHCWDESDTMCYADGGNHAMVQVCPTDREYLLDCNSDDYFSTYPDPGSYLDTRWNSADSRFLIGGGNGSGGGDAGTPTVLGAITRVNNPAVPGLPTQVEVDVALPTGRTLSSVSWTAARADCVFADPTAVQSEVTCDAAATGSTTVTARVTDSSGAVKSASSLMTFAPGGSRPVSLALAVDSQEQSASVCTRAGYPVTATVVDNATGRPVKGLSVSFTKQTATTTAGTAGAARTGLAGTATVTGSAASATTYQARLAATATYAAAQSTSLVATPSVCATTLESSIDTRELYYGDPVVVSGRLTRVVGGVTVGVAGASLPVRLTYPSGTTTKYLLLGTAKTAADGTYTITTRPTRSGAVGVVLAASASYLARSAAAGDVVVHLPDSSITGQADRTSAGYGSAVVVTGQLTKTSGALTTGEVTTGVGGATVAVIGVDAAGVRRTLASGRTAPDGSYRISATVTKDVTLLASSAAAPGRPAASVQVGAVDVESWTTSLDLAPYATTTGLGLRGTVTRTFGDASSGAKGVRVRILFTPTGGQPTLVATTTSTTGGAYVTRVYPTTSGTYTAEVRGVVGYLDAVSNGVTVG